MMSFRVKRIKMYLVTLPAIKYVSCLKSYAFQWHKHLLKFYDATYGSLIKSIYIVYDKTNIENDYVQTHFYIMKSI